MLSKEVVLSYIPLTVFKKMMSQYSLDVESGVHGYSHWARVAENALMISATENNSKSAEAVCIAFALFHDICRLNENSDYEHGCRGADLMELYRDEINLSNEEFHAAYTACKDHTNCVITEDGVLVGACFDADRLDLGRVGITPDAQYMNTDFAKSDVIISAAIERSVRNYCPNWMKEIIRECNL